MSFAVSEIDFVGSEIDLTVSGNDFAVMQLILP